MVADCSQEYLVHKLIDQVSPVDKGFNIQQETDLDHTWDDEEVHLNPGLWLSQKHEHD